MQWSPFAGRDSWVVSTSNQKALVWNLAMRSWQDSIEHVLHGHTRAITDINFSAHHPDVLATCAVDSFVHCWDLRIPARPVVSFSDWFAGATQVKWNRQNAHVVASSHDKYLRVWDDRMGAYPVRSIEAHDTKIYGVDWNRHSSSQVVTCSLDKTIKFWDSNNLEDIPTKTIRTPFPVWRARHTPFGWGLLAMPQRGSSDLHLYDRRSTDNLEAEGVHAPAAAFQGHKGQVKEFLWRPRGTIVDQTDNREFQLVSWGTDRELRLHKVDPKTYLGVGYERGISKIPRLNFTRKGAPYKTFRDEPQDVESNEVFEPGSSPGPAQSFPTKSRASLSVGMSKVPIPQVRGWVHGPNMGSRIGMHGKTNVRQDTNPITWMKGVKIANWDAESLGEEITHVGEQFSKVSFEAVDVQKRKATISMQGPWGSENSSLFMKIEIRFPVEYPRAASPSFSVQKTALMTDQISTTIISELRALAGAYISRKRGCLEAVLRYLLRERNLEQSIDWIKGNSDDDVKLADENDVGEGLSSDEDDEAVGGFQDPDLGLSSSELLRPVNANVMVPVAKACGAIWADNGSLVCFFPPKQKQPASFLDSLGLREGDRSSRSDKIFEGFGRLQTSSPGPKTALGTVSTADELASEYSDDSYSTSSSSSGSSDLLVTLPTRFQAPHTWRGGTSGLQRSRSADHSLRSTNGLGSLRPASEVPSNIISIHDLQDLLPAKRDLATEYQLFGNGPRVCAHNAAVAAKYDRHDLVYVWKLLKMILHNQVPLDCLSNLKTGDSIIVVAQQAAHSLQRKDSGIDLSHDETHRITRAPAKGRVRWGESSLGGKWLVPALFDHFEQTGDVQMLAMLSCILSEPKRPGHGTADYPKIGHDLPMHLNSAAFSLDYYPTIEVARSLKERTTLFSTSRAILPPASAQHSTGSSADVWNSDPTTPFSTGNTPPYQYHRPGRASIDHDRDFTLQRTASSVSISPELRFNRRSNSNLASTMASSLSRTAVFASSSSNSPPSNSLKKRPSPSESSIGAPTSGWIAASTMFGGKVPGTIHEHSGLPTSSSAVTQSFTDSETDMNMPTKSHSKIKVTLKNQNHFDLDGYASVPLLDPLQDWRYKAYRAAYARLLLVWNLPIAMCEVRKFDGLPSYIVPESAEATNNDGNTTKPGMAGPSLLTLDGSLRGGEGILSPNSSTGAQYDCLGLQRHCPQCGDRLSAIEKNGIAIAWQCPRCVGSKKVGQRMMCIVCESVVTGLYMPCLKCRHVAHFDCQHEWFLEGNADGNSTTCAAGCGCACSEHFSVEGPWPNEEQAESDTGGDTDTEVDEDDVYIGVSLELQSRRLPSRRDLSHPPRATTSALRQMYTAAAPMDKYMERDSHPSDRTDMENDPMWLNAPYATFNRPSQGTTKKRTRMERSETMR